MDRIDSLDRIFPVCSCGTCQGLENMFGGLQSIFMKPSGSLVNVLDFIPPPWSYFMSGDDQESTVVDKRFYIAVS